MKNQTVGSQVLPNLRYDGTMMGMYQFTEIDKQAPSYGATFYVGIEGFTMGKLETKRAAKRAEFGPLTVARAGKLS